MTDVRLLFIRKLQSGLERPARSPAYLKWVRTLPCSICARPGPSEAHHLVGYGFKAVGAKTTDYWTMPLCREHHEAFTVERKTSEEVYGSQWFFVVATITQAIYSGVLK